MLLGNILTTPTGIRLYDVDGSYLELNAEDALDLSDWLLRKKEQLQEIVRVIGHSALWTPTEQETEIARYNRELDERNRISAENRDKPWLPLHDGE